MNRCEYLILHQILDDCGDHVVVINSKEVALRGDEWKKRVYFHHTGYPKGASWTLAWQLHEKDPTMVSSITDAKILYIPNIYVFVRL